MDTREIAEFLASYLFSESGDHRLLLNTRKDFIEHIYLTCSRQQLRPSGPVIVGWGLTRKCNLACRHCSVNTSPSFPASPRTLEEEARIIDQATEAAAILLVLTGGEPFLNPLWPNVVQHAKARGRSIALLTNATTLTDKDISLLAEMLRYDEDHIQVSLDGVTEETYAAQRGVRVLSRVLASIRRMVEKGLYVTVNFTATQYNLDEMVRTLGLADELGVVECNFNPVSPKGRALRNTYLDPLKYVANLVDLISLSKELDTRLTFSLPVEVFSLLQECALFPPVNGPASATFFLIEENCSLSISQSGLMTLGTELGSDFAIGYIEDISIKEAWENARPLIRDLTGTKCERCHYVSYCQGGRADMAHQFFGTINRPDPRCRLRC